MKLHTTVLAVVLASAFSAGVSAQEGNLTETEIRSRLVAAGFSKIENLEFKNGTWTADVDSPDGRAGKVTIDAKTGKAYNAGDVASRLGQTEIESRLATQGYKNVHDLKFDNGFWHGDADDPSGKSVEIKVDPKTGEVIGTEDK